MFFVCLTPSSSIQIVQHAPYPIFCCPFSYTVTELCIFLGFTASHLLQPSCSSFCQQSFIMPFIVNPSMLFSLFISLFTFILPIALAYCFALIVVYACCSISALHAINAPCSIIDCHFILLIIWFMPVIHSLLLIYTQLFTVSSFSLFHSNLRSLSKHIDELQILLSSTKIPFDIIGVSETKEQVDNSFLTNVNLYEYDFYSQPSKASAGGVAIYIKSSLNYVIRDDLNRTEDKFECIWVEIKKL